MHVLIVDDDEDIIVILEFRLKKAGYSITVAKDGNAALQAVRSSKPDLILIDLNIPAPNGKEVCETIKKDAALSSIPIILLTGASSAAKENVPADSCVMKPYEWPDLEKEINKLVSSKT